MPLDPQAAALIASAAGGPPVEQMSIEEGRVALEERIRLTGGTPQDVASVRDLRFGTVPCACTRHLRPGRCRRWSSFMAVAG